MHVFHQNVSFYKGKRVSSLIFKACYALIVRTGTLYIVLELFHSPLEDSLMFKQQLPL